jgi:hypothetical protein
MDRRIANINTQIMKLKREKEHLIWMKNEKERLHDDCYEEHREFNGFQMFFSPNPHKERYGETCVICIENFTRTDDLLLTECAHLFHTECFRKNEKFNGKTCPVCK